MWEDGVRFLSPAELSGRLLEEVLGLASWEALGVGCG